MQEAIDHCGGKSGIAEKLAPVDEGFVARDNRRAMLVALAH
jgi:hypothetical protein